MFKYVRKNCSMRDSTTNQNSRKISLQVCTHQQILLIYLRVG